jgi:transposase
MSLHVAPLPALPEAPARVARAAFKRKANTYLTIGDRLGSLFEDVDFGCLYAADGKSALSPNLLALVTIFQFMENLSDRDNMPPATFRAVNRSAARCASHSRRAGPSGTGR